MVTLVAKPTHTETHANLTTTRLYQNLTDQVTSMAFYDVKNARLCNVFQGEGLTHREPLVDEKDFEKFTATVDGLLKAGRDCFWVLIGRVESNEAKIAKILKKYRFKKIKFILNYNTKMMQQYGHWRRMRGAANSKSAEVLFLCYHGVCPKMPSTRKYVDAGSAIFHSVVRHVPVLHPKNQSFVDRAVRDTSLASMVGVPHDEDPDEKELEQEAQAAAAEEDQLAETAQAESADAQTKKFAQQHYKKRKLYRQPSNVTVPWFPHDNDPDLLKELCWEANRPRWVFYGTPAGGAGVFGCLEMGCSVVALCYDDHHRDHFGNFVLERCVEAMAYSSSSVFKDPDLQARSVELHLSASSTEKAATAAKEDEDAQKDEASKMKKKKKAETPKKKNKANKKADKKAAAAAKNETPKKKRKAEADEDADDDDSDDDSDDSDDDSSDEPTARRTPKKAKAS